MRCVSNVCATPRRDKTLRGSGANPCGSCCDLRTHSSRISKPALLLTVYRTRSPTRDEEAAFVSSEYSVVRRLVPATHSILARMSRHEGSVAVRVCVRIFVHGGFVWASLELTALYAVLQLQSSAVCAVFRRHVRRCGCRSVLWLAEPRCDHCRVSRADVLCTSSILILLVVAYSFLATL